MNRKLFSINSLIASFGIFTVLNYQSNLNADFFPTAEELNATSSLVNIDPQNDPNSVKSFIKYDMNTSGIVDLNATIIESLADRLGYLKPDSSLSLSSRDGNKTTINAENLKGYVNAMKLKMPSAGASIADQLKQKMQEFDANNPATYSSTALLANGDVNSTQLRAITTHKQLNDAIRSKIANLKTVDCYVTRKLTNSYFCPLPSMSTSSFTSGGSFPESKEDAKKRCENLCNEDVSCMSLDMNKELSHVTTHNQELSSSGINLSINADPTMLAKYIELSFNIEHNVYKDDNDTNQTAFKEYLISKKNKFLMDVNAYSTSSDLLVPFLTSRTVLIDEPIITFKIYLDTIRSSQYNIVFHPHHFDMEQNGTINSDSNLTVTLKSSKLQYADNKFWFCPATHFTEDATTCKGEVKTIILGSSTYKVCVTKEAQEREPIYGAYYTQQDCSSKCKVYADCQPTYKHINAFDPLNLPTDISDIDFGCINSPTNTSCNKDLCEKLFTDDDMPLVERSWINDDSIKITVANGIQQPGAIRPRIDFTRGVSANGDTTARQEINLGEMVEVSYANMMELDNFNVSSKTVKESIPFRNAYSETPNGMSKIIHWLLKPNSYDIDDSKTYYFYNVYEVDGVYRPMYGTFETADGIQSGKTDPNIRIQERTYLLKTQNGFKPIKRTNFMAGKFKHSDCKDVVDVNGYTSQQCTYSYNWGPIDAYKKDENKTYNTASGLYLAYDMDSLAEHFANKQLTSDNKYESFHSFDSIEEIAGTEGVLFVKQESQSNGASFSRVYKGEENILEKEIFANINAYGIYSSTQLTYNELLERISNDTMFYSTSAQLPKEILADSYFDNGKVKFYVSGKPSKLSVNADFLPNSQEEGKRTFIYMLLFEEEK